MSKTGIWDISYGFRLSFAKIHRMHKHTELVASFWAMYQREKLVYRKPFCATSSFSRGFYLFFYNFLTSTWNYTFLTGTDHHVCTVKGRPHPLTADLAGVDPSLPCMAVESVIRMWVERHVVGENAYGVAPLPLCGVARRVFASTPRSDNPWSARFTGELETWPMVSQTRRFSCY